MAALMPIKLELNSVNYAAMPAYISEADHDRGADPAQVILAFLEPRTGIEFHVIFDGVPWQNFKRHVESDGKVMAPVIEIAGSVPRMDIPKGL